MCMAVISLYNKVGRRRKQWCRVVPWGASFGLCLPPRVCYEAICSTHIKRALGRMSVQKCPQEESRGYRRRAVATVAITWGFLPFGPGA